MPSSRPEADSPTRPQVPALTVDGVILLRRRIGHRRSMASVLLIQRGCEPFRGRWAFPGGFVTYGEDLLDAVQREVTEETGLSGLPFRQFRAYGQPGRDPRGHTVSVVFVAEIVGDPPEVQGGDDAAKAAWFPLEAVPALAFDHERILADVRALLGLPAAGSPAHGAPS